LLKLLQEARELIEKVLNDKDLRNKSKERFNKIAELLRKAVSFILDNEGLDEELRRKLDKNLEEFLKEIDKIIDEIAFDFLAAGIVVGHEYLSTYGLWLALREMRKHDAKLKYKMMPKATWYRYLKKLEWVTKSDLFKPYRNVLECIPDTRKTHE